MRFFENEKVRKFYNLQTHIVVVFLVLFLTTFVTIITYTYRENSNTIVNLSENILDRTGDIIIEKIQNNLSLAQLFSYVGDQCINSETEINIENQSILAPMRAMLQNSPFVTSVSAGNKSGDFLKITRVLPERVYHSDQRKRIPSDAKFMIQYISRSSGVKNETCFYENAATKIVGKEIIEKSSYDHRNEKWYKEAEYSKTTYWSDLSIIDLTQKPGFTVSSVILNNSTDEFLGVFSLDIGTEEISGFLSASKIGERSSLAVIDHNNSVVARSDARARTMEKAPSQGANVIMTIKEMNDKILEEAYCQYEEKKIDTLSFNLKDSPYIATFVKFPRIVTYKSLEKLKTEVFEKYWTLAIVVPSEEFLGSIIKTKSYVVIFSFILMLISIGIMIVLARHIAKPIIQLANESIKIKNFDLSESSEPKSVVYEIRLLISAIVSMRYSMRAFSKFIPKVLVGKLLKHNREIKIGGKEARTTFLFTDIANFTSISENYPPDRLTQHLSEYFEELSSIIFKYNGLIDKYIGDAIMAFWGAPVKDKDQALHACKAAVAIQKKLLLLNEQWSAEGKPMLLTRIGLHVGDVIVGNMGSSDRLNYTALGDSVNLAARLEGVNKIYGTNIIISKDIVKELGAKACVCPLDVVAVKGRDEGVEIFELIGIFDDEPSLLPSKKKIAFAEAFNRGYQLYRDKLWKEALKSFQSMKRDHDEHQAVSLYIQRCEEFIKNPPGEDWNGVSVLHEK